MTVTVIISRHFKYAKHCEQNASMKRPLLVIYKEIIQSTAFWGISLLLYACASGEAEPSPEADEDNPETAETGENDDDAKQTLVDIVNYARLNASGTATELFPWPREALDSASTIRDERPDTSWKIPEGSPSMLQIDFQPWLQAEASLKSVRLQFSGAVDRLRVERLEACRGKVLQTIEREELLPVLGFSGEKAGCLQIYVHTSGPAQLEELEIMAWVPETALWNTQNETSTGPNHPKSGVIEGFYGVPWSWTERMRMIDLLCDGGLGTYLYAPKWDPIHREQWREIYSEEEREHFKELISYASERGVMFSFGISPFLDFDTHSEDDYAILAAKTEGFLAMGAQSVTLLADDIEFALDTPVDADMGTLHTDIANRLLNDMKTVNPDIQLDFVPTVYSDDRVTSFDEGMAYLEALQSLDSTIGVYWTGPGTSNARMTAEEMHTFTEAVGRKPIIWDNFWANDGGDGFTGRIPLGAFSGRDALLVETVSGILHNPSIQGALSRLTLGTFLEYLHDPIAYNPNKARESAVNREMTFRIGTESDSTSDQEAVLFLMKLFDGDAQTQPGSREMETRIDSLTRSLRDDAACLEDASLLLPLFSRMSVLESEIHHSGLATDIVDELVFPLEKIRYEGEAGIALLKALVRKLEGEPADTELQRAEEALAKSNTNRFIFSNGKLHELFETVSDLVPLTHGGKVLQATTLDPECQTRNEWKWVPFAEDCRMHVFGLSGAEIENGQITWHPLHSGSYRVSAVCIMEGCPPSLGEITAEFVCETPGE